MPATKTARRSAPKAAPVVWKFKTRTSALGIFVDDNLCWIGNQKGQVFALDHKGKVQRQYKLPDGVMALVGDAAWMYAGCNNGNVYDITGDTPRLAYEIEKGDAIDWIDICDGLLAASTSNGKVTLIDAESQVLWSHQGESGGWTVRVDHKSVYHGDDDKVVAYDRVTGKRRWRQKTGMIMFGWQTETSMYVGTGNDKIVRLAKKDGKKQVQYLLDGGVPSCATSPDGKYVFGEEGGGIITCFEEKGKRLWNLKTGCGNSLSMQYHQGRLYVVTGTGYLACIDLSAAAIRAAEAGKATKPREIKAPKTGGKTVSRKVETTSNPGSGVILECVKDGSALRMHVVSKGYRKDWFVQFPRDIRKLGARYVVDEVRVATQGGFYRAYGTIKKLVSTPSRKQRS